MIQDSTNGMKLLARLGPISSRTPCSTEAKTFAWHTTVWTRNWRILHVSVHCYIRTPSNFRVQWTVGKVTCLLAQTGNAYPWRREGERSGNTVPRFRKINIICCVIQGHLYCSTTIISRLSRFRLAVAETCWNLRLTVSFAIVGRVDKTTYYGETFPFGSWAPGYPRTVLFACELFSSLDVIDEAKCCNITITPCCHVMFISKSLNFNAPRCAVRL